MTVVAAPAVPRDVVELLVARLHRELGGDRDELRARVVAGFAAFATARVQTFVPLLVEKRVRAACRGRRDGDP